MKDASTAELGKTDSTLLGLARRAPVARNSTVSGTISAWVRAHPIAAYIVWFYPVAWAIALLPLAGARPFGLELALAALAYGPPQVAPSTVVSALVRGLLVQTVILVLFVNLWEEVGWMGF